MTKEIEFTRGGTNLQVSNCVVHIHNNNKYRVVYIDLVESKAVLVSLNYANTTHILDLNDSSFEILFYDFN